MDETVRFIDIPLGAWDLKGQWHPNYRLEMSVEEQIKHNVAGGHFNKDITYCWQTTVH